MTVVNQLNPNQDINAIANFNKPENVIDTVYYGKFRLSPGPGGEIPVTSLAGVSALLTEMLAAIPQPAPGMAARVQYAQAWISYMGPDGGLVQGITDAVKAILTAATSD